MERVTHHRCCGSCLAFDRGRERVGVLKRLAQIGKGGVDGSVLSGEGCGVVQRCLQRALCSAELFQGALQADRRAEWNGCAIDRLRGGLRIGTDLDEAFTDQALLAQPCCAGWANQLGFAVLHFELHAHFGVGHELEPSHLAHWNPGDSNLFP